ncbi:MAG: Ig-like domain-containing protein [Christensenellales bacterium]|nr:Ig-like domain-containing protein [Christensenellales bacterium]
MKRWISVCLIAVMLLGSGALAAESREELRRAYQALGTGVTTSPYEQMPSVKAPYASGALSQTAREDALAYLNFLRSLAGLAPVTCSRLYEHRSQHGAVLLAALDYAAHDAPNPGDMPADFYDSAHTATLSSNLAKFNWMRPSILREGLAYFVRDDGEENLPVLGHRRWLLNPVMAETGFGLANSGTGMSYVVMYALDDANAQTQWDAVCWPSKGFFPVELMHWDLAWSVSLNPERYDVEHSRIAVELTEATQGLQFQFNAGETNTDGFCGVSMEAYGAGPCLIFRPDFEGTEFTDYQQNQRWQVRVSGLRTWTGEEIQLEYVVEMASLYPQEVANLELSQVETTMRAGENLSLSVSVIPAYADDLEVMWSSSDTGVATVAQDGTVTAVAPGVCQIRAESANGKYDSCRLTVVFSDS